MIKLNNIEFKLFKEQYNWYQGYTEGGMKVEFKTTRKGVRVIAGQNLPDEVLEELHDLLPHWKRYSEWIIREGTQEDVETSIQEVAEAFDKIDYEVKRRRVTTDSGYFEGVANIIKAAVDNGFWHVLDRNALGFDAHDSLITLGKSKAVIADPTSPQWREHIVPCTMIIEHAVELFESGATVPVVAQMIKENLAIVIITAAEAKTVDALYQTTMPEGWKWGDTVFARLDALNIKY